jgi:hypothetical protein
VIVSLGCGVVVSRVHRHPLSLASMSVRIRPLRALQHRFPQRKPADRPSGGTVVENGRQRASICLDVRRMCDRRNDISSWTSAIPPAMNAACHIRRADFPFAQNARQ